MSSQPPGPGRLQAARASGLRPRSGWLVLAVLALALARLVPANLEGPAAWLDHRLARAFDPSPSDLLGNPVHGSWLALATGSLVALAAVRAIAGSRARLVPAIDAARAQIPIATRIGLTCLGLVLALGLLGPVVAAAAHGVDVPPSSLATFWLAWLRRALLSVAVCAGLLGVLERIASAKQLWLALHLSPEQARALGQTRQR